MEPEDALKRPQKPRAMYAGTGYLGGRGNVVPWRLAARPLAEEVLCQ